MAGQVITKVNANSGIHLISTSFYGTCSTAAGTAAKAVIVNDSNITDAITLVNGMTLTVKFTNSNSAANPTITVYNNSGTAAAPTQGSTTLIAAKSIYQVNTNLNAAGTAASTTAATSWKAGAIVVFVYDGQGWVEVSSTYNQDNDTTALTSMTGTLTVTQGGTGKTTATEAWTALGGGDIGKKNTLSASDIPSLDYLPLTGGTLTGKLISKENNLDITNIPASNIYNGAIDFVDTNEKQLGNITRVSQSDGYYGISIGVYDSDSDISNSLSFLLNDEGTKKISVEPTIWRTALGIGTIGTKNTLTESDIPNIAASKINSGTLAVTYGGTGADNAADARANLLAVGYQDGMNAAIANFTGATQLWGLRAKVINTNSDYVGDSVYILMRTNGVSCWDTTQSSYLWQLTLPSDTTDLSINTATPTLNSNATATKFETRRQGSVVNLVVYQLKVAASLADGSSIALGTGIIGSNARPSTYIYMPLMANVSGKGAGCFLYITAAGNVTLYNRSGSALGTNTSLSGNTSWVV